MFTFAMTLARFGRAVVGIRRDPERRGLVTLALVTVAGGTWFYHLVEGWSWLDSLWFSVVTLTTVGYGDLVPVTDAGKVFTMAYLVTGIGILLAFVTEVAGEVRRGQRARAD